MTFWSQFPPALCLPDNCDCEFVRDALIAQPSAFVSSIAYIFFALLLYVQTKNKNTDLKLWTMSFVILGLSSHLAHASFIEPAIALDFAGIVLIISFFFVIKGLKRWLAKTWQIAFILVGYFGGMLWTFFPDHLVLH